MYFKKYTLITEAFFNKNRIKVKCKNHERNLCVLVPAFGNEFI